MSSMQIIHDTECPHCNQRLFVKQLSFDLHGYCEHCFKFVGIIREADKCCNNTDTRFVKHENRDGRFQLRQQCQNCYAIPSRSYKQEGTDMDLLPASCRRSEAAVVFTRHQESIAFRSEFRAVFTEETNVNAEILENKIGYDEYLEYLNSKEWRSKRLKVLERDKYVCQSCLSAEAKEVHHITYKHLKNEPLFELVSVCKPCHLNITRMDNGEDFTRIESKLYENLLS